MLTQSRDAIGRSAAAIAVVAIVVLAGVIASSYLGAPRGGTKTSTGSSASQASGAPSPENGNCSVGAAFADEWLTFKHDSQRTGYSPFNFSSSAAGRFAGQLVWQNKSGFSEMAATQTELFVAGYWLFAINMSSGRGLWTETTGAGPAPPIASDGKTVYLGANTGGFYAFNATTGASAPVGNVTTLGSAAICGDTAYITAERGEFDQPPAPESSILAVNLTSGKNLWEVDLATQSFAGYPTTDGRIVYSVVDNSTIVAFAADSGAVLWKKAFPQGLNSTSSTTQYVTTSGNRTTTIDLTLPNGVVQTPPLAYGELFVTTTDGHVFALNATNGNEVWARSLGVGIVNLRASSAVGYGKVFLGTSGGLYAIDASNGSIAWKAPLASFQTSTPTVVDGSVFIADSTGTLYQFDASNGAQLWHFTGLGEGYVSEPIVAGGLIAVDGNNGVFAFR